MPKTAHKVVVIGHRNPDTDSICSAIAYAELKNKTSSLVCEARRAGRMNQETEFVLKRFGVAPPRMCTDVNPKIRDVDYREMPGIPGSTSLRKAWEIMRDQQIDTLPITSADDELEGIITVKDIATANMDVFDTGVLATSRTTYKNILETLGGTMVVGNENAACLQNGFVLGTAGMLDGLADHFCAELGPETKFYATGNLPTAIRDACRTPILYRETLITDGLYCIWLRNRR